MMQKQLNKFLWYIFIVKYHVTSKKNDLELYLLARKYPMRK